MHRAGPHRFALLADGRVRGWGWNTFSAVGSGTTGDIMMPPAVVIVLSHK